MPAVETGLFKVQQPGKEPQGVIRKAMEKKRAKTEHIEMVLNGPRMASVRERFVQFQERFSNKEGKGTRRRRRRKGDTKRKGPKSTSPSGKSTKPVCYHFQKGSAKRIRMRLLAPTRVPTLQVSMWMRMAGIRVYSSSQVKAGEDKNGSATIAIKMEETKEVNCVLEDCQGDTF